MLFGTVSASVSAKLTDGNFWQGAATGLVVSGLNHAAHRMRSDSYLLKDLSSDELSENSSEDGILSGKITFKGLKQRQLKEFRVIPEDPAHKDDLIIPNNDVTYDTDGFYHVKTTEEMYWYKIAGLREVTVRYLGGAYRFFTNVTSPLSMGDAGWRSIKEKKHWTTNPFYHE